jgi:hypothetical protein
VEEAQNTTNKRGGSGRACGPGGKNLDSHHFEAQRRVELETPPEAAATIQMPKSK